MGDKAKAEESLNKALKINPKSAAANFNLGLLKAEQNDLPKAEQYLRAALKEDPTWPWPPITSASSLPGTASARR